MSDDNNNFRDELDDLLGDAKEGAKKAADKAEEFAKDAKEKAKEFANEAKHSAKEFSENAQEAFNDVSGENKKVLSGIIAILFGWVGIHKFILGYSKEGVILLVLGLLGFFTCGITSGISGLIGLVEGIIYLTKSDEEFYRIYQIGNKPWF
jgi:TM2 domain-containing membrane protein YozV